MGVKNLWRGLLSVIIIIIITTVFVTILINFFSTQPGPSKVAPPTPTTEDSAPLIPTDHTKNVATVHVPRHNQISGIIPTSDSSSTVSSGSSTTPNTSSSTTSSSSSTAPSSPASPPPRTQAVPPRTITQYVIIRKQKIIQLNVFVFFFFRATSNCSTPQRIPPPRPNNREKRHSFTSLTIPHHSTNTHRHSAEILGTEPELQQQQQAGELPRRMVGLSDVQLPAAYIALYPYKPQKPDELELRKGGIYMVTERCQDGWFKGEHFGTKCT